MGASISERRLHDISIYEYGHACEYMLRGQYMIHHRLTIVIALTERQLRKLKQEGPKMDEWKGKLC